MEKSVPKNRQGANKTTGMEGVLGLSVPLGHLSCWLQDHEQLTPYREHQYRGQCYGDGSFAKLSHGMSLGENKVIYEKSILK